jgi:hypothetical protein
MNGIVRFPPVTEGTEDDRRVRARFAALKEFELLHSSSPRCKDKNQDQETLLRRRVASPSASTPPNRNRPHPQPLLVLGRLWLRRHQLPLLQRHLRRFQNLASGAVLCVAQSATQFGEPSVAPAQC